MNKLKPSFLYKCFYSCVVATLFMLIIYFTMNLPFPVPLSIESQKLKWFEDIRSWGGDGVQSNQSPDYKDSLLYIDVCYDQTMALEYDRNGGWNGFIPVADHEKIFRLLKILQEQQCQYRYIILDILFESHIHRQPIDSALFNLICQMPNIVVPIPTASDLSDSCLTPRAFRGEYFIPYGTGGFTRYPYLPKDEACIPLKMYQDLTGRNIENWRHLFYFDRGLVRNNVFLTFDFTDNSIDTLEMSSAYNHVYIGRFLGDSIENVKFTPRVLNESLTRGKYIVIGNSQTDRHSTYLGPITGPIINFNAYLSLVNGRHRVSWGFILCAVIIMSVLCFHVIFGSQSWISRLLRKTGGTTKGTTLMFTIFCFLTYSFFLRVYDIFIVVFLFFTLAVFKDLCRIGTSKISQLGYVLLLLLSAVLIGLLPYEVIAKYFFYIIMLIPIYKIVRGIVILFLNNN